MATDPKTIVRRFHDELWNKRNAAAAETILAEKVVWHHPTFGEIRGHQALLEVIREMHAAYADLMTTEIHMLAEGDMVASHWSAAGTHRQPYRGRTPCTQRLTWGGVTLHRVADGRIVEMWGFPHTTIHGSPHEILHRQPTLKVQTNC